MPTEKYYCRIKSFCIVKRVFISGVYKIRSRSHLDRLYIGSAVDIQHRKNQHLCDLRKNQHRSIKLQRHYNKYGEDDLIFETIAKCQKEELIPQNGIIWIEQVFIDAYKPYFNTAKFAGSQLGTKRTKESRLKMSNAHKGKKLSEEHKKSLAIARKNRRVVSTRDFLQYNGG